MNYPAVHRVGARRLGHASCVLGVLAAVANLGLAADVPASGRAQCRVVIWGNAGDKTIGPLVFLDRPRDAIDAAPKPRTEIGSNGLLIRELVRQAVSIAARDGCGARTRDALLGDAGKPEKPSAVLVLEWDLPKKGPSTILLRTDAGDPLWKAPALLDGLARDPDRLAESLAAQAAGPLIDAMVKAGLKRVDRKPEADDFLPQEIEEPLNRMTVVSQFAAIRGLHDRVRSRGRSPILLGALARSYALLGVLTEHHWNAAHKVYKARALLYGEEAAAAEPKSPAGLWSLAFAEALVGRQRDALEHLIEADRREVGKKKPPWVERIRFFASDDLSRLVEGDSATDPLARLLAYICIEGGSGIYQDYSDLARSQILMASKEVLLLEPESFRVLDGTCRFSGVSLLHQATTIPAQLFEGSLRKSLEVVPGIPVEMGDDIPKSLDRVGQGIDRGEPGLSALASIVRETRFVQAWRRLDFVTFKLAAPGIDGDLRDQRLPTDHPLMPFLTAHEKGFRQPDFMALARKLDGADIELTAVPLIDQVRGVDPVLANRLFERAMSHGDEIARDLAEEIRFGPNEVGMALATGLLMVRPNSPVARIVFVVWDKTLDPKLAARWEKDPTAGPGLLGALGKRYSAAKRWADAERCFSLSIAASPDRWIFRALAQTYKAQGMTDKWRSTLEAFLLQEDYALDHAQVRNEIARDYMSRKQYREALPYAEAAAQSWAAWAMYTASECREKLGDWKESEEWIQAVSERYTDQAAAWFWWCKRTEHGDIEAALGFVKPQLAAIANSIRQPLVAYTFGNVLIAAGEPRMALDLALRFHDRRPDAILNTSADAIVALRIAMLADSLGDPALRDRALRQFLNPKGKGGPITKSLLAVIRDWLAKPDADKVGPDLARIDAILGALPEGRGDLAYYAAVFLENHGRKEDAIAYLAVAASKSLTETNDANRTLARMSLRDRGLDPDKVPLRPLAGAATAK